jgi:hypothetical protein
LNINQAFLNAIVTWADFYESLPFLLGTDDKTGVNFVKFEKEFLEILDSEMLRPITRDEMSTFVNNVLPDMLMGGVYAE